MVLLLHQLAIGVLLLSADVVTADKYASNQNPIVIDTPLVAKNFPPVEGIELLSPAFANPGDVPATFANGTSGPTPQQSLGKYKTMTLNGCGLMVIKKVL